MKSNAQIRGICFGLTSAILLGLSPVFGRFAISKSGISPFFVVAFRSSMATLLLFLLMMIFKRKYLYIYPLGLLGCFFAGALNGIGSILYYSALTRLEASVGQLLYSFYPVFVVFWLILDRHRISKVTILRLIISFPGIFLLLSSGKQTGVDWIGALMMLGAAILYALHLIINQRILYEAPAPTVTFYTLISMSAVVIIAWLLFDRSFPAQGISWMPVIGMAVILFLSRMTLFLGVKHLGGIQTAILGLGELLTTVLIAHLWLRETLSTLQWLGALLLLLSTLLVGFDPPSPAVKPRRGILAWLNPPHVTPTDIHWDN